MKKILIVTFACLATMSYGNVLLAERSDLYVGLDVLKSNYSTQEHYGKNVFARDPITFNAFVGYKLPRNFFVEAGYETHKSKDRSENNVDVGSLPGLNANYGIPTNTKTKIKLNFPYLGIGINYPITFIKNTSISGLIALSATKLKAEQNDVLYNAYDGNFSKHKVTPLLKININYYITNSIHVRLNTTWHKLKNTEVKEESGNPLILKMKDGISMGIGIAYSFN